MRARTAAPALKPPAEELRPRTRPPPPPTPLSAGIPRDPDRLVFFTDAVVAIAITLLVLPLVDVVPVAAQNGQSATEVITDHQPEVFGFLLSFAVITRLWFAHHNFFRHVRAYSRPRFWPSRSSLRWPYRS